VSPHNRPIIIIINPVSIDKHFINDPTQLVLSALKAAKYANPSVSLDEVNKIIFRKPSGPEAVALVSGGGAGHEPSFAGYSILFNVSRALTDNMHIGWSARVFSAPQSREQYSPLPP
jgi:dihydroxyacetone kinase